MLRKILRERYESARKFLGLTREQVGQGAGMSATAVRYFEIGRNDLPNHFLTQFLVENGISYYYLIGESEEMQGTIKLTDYVLREDYEDVKKQLSESVPKEEYERLKIKYEGLQEMFNLKDK